MEEIKRLKNKGGPEDGVEARVNCVVTTFESEGKGGMQKSVKDMQMLPCNVIAAYSNGTIGFSVRKMNVMISVRIDELYDILKEAAAAANDLKLESETDMTDEKVEFLWRNFLKVQLDTADSPSGLVLAGKWRQFPKGTDSDDIKAWFGNIHSKGIKYLMQLSH